MNEAALIKLYHTESEHHKQLLLKLASFDVGKKHNIYNVFCWNMMFTRGVRKN